MKLHVGKPADPPDRPNGKRWKWPSHLFAGRIRTSTVVLILAFAAIWWVYDTYREEPTPPPAPQVVPPGFIPDPAYTWVPRTKLQPPPPTVTETVTPTSTPTEPPPTPTEPPAPSPVPGFPFCPPLCPPPAPAPPPEPAPNPPPPGPPPSAAPGAHQPLAQPSAQQPPAQPGPVTSASPPGPDVSHG